MVSLLRKFAVTGYRGFKDRLVFDLTHPHDYEFNKHIIHDGVVSSGVIYGINGSGKSSLGFAVFDIVGVLTDYELAEPMKDKTSFINAQSLRERVKFEYEFQLGGKVIQYIYEKTAPDEIFSEEVISDGVSILKRTAAGVEFTLTPELNFPELMPSMSAVRYVYRNTNLTDGSPIAQIVSFVEKMLWFRSLNIRGYCGYTSGSAKLTEELYKLDKVREFEQFLRDTAGIDLKLEIIVSPSGMPELYIDYPSRKVNFFNASSTGTQELLLLFYWMSYALADVKFLFIDEFDAFYHFELAAKIVSTLSRNARMQSFFTSHNTYLASNSIMRPDCFFILSDGKITSFADATARELREGHNLEKMFRNGEFGV